MKTVKVSNMDITPPKTTSGDYNSEMSQQMGLMHSKALFVHRRNSSALFVHQQFCLFVVSVKQLNSFRIRAERSPTLYQLYKKYRAG